MKAPSTVNNGSPDYRGHSIWAYQKFNDKQIEEVIIKTRQRIRNGDDEKRFIICKNCKNAITSFKNVIEINGSHQHTFKNPRGIVYQIGCFISARGCIDVGNPTAEFTWFPGFSWCYAICSRCLIHLGWNYQSTGESFYGLILDNLTESS